MDTEESKHSQSGGLLRTVTERVLLSVVVSTRNSESTLRQVLTAIRGSELPRKSFEIIVVDDASADGSVAIAARFADTVVKLTGHQAGPAYARNRGVELARGEVIAFVDSEVVVRPDTIPRLMRTLLERPEVDAVSATHEESSGSPNFVSQYWNLLLSFGEHRHSGRGAQFAAGCGVVLRAALLSAGMYDEWRFDTPSMESVELGERLLGAGRGVILCPELKVSHLKKWDFASVCQEVWHRGRVLARSLGYFRMSAVAPGEVMFTLCRTLIPAVAILGTLMLAAAFVPAPHPSAKFGVALAALFLTNLPVHRFYAETRGLWFAVASAPLHILVQIVAAIALCTGWILRDVFGDVSPDATTQAYSEVGLEIWPPVPRRP